MRFNYRYSKANKMVICETMFSDICAITISAKEYNYLIAGDRQHPLAIITSRKFSPAVTIEYGTALLKLVTSGFFN